MKKLGAVPRYSNIYIVCAYCAKQCKLNSHANLIKLVVNAELKNVS